MDLKKKLKDAGLTVVSDKEMGKIAKEAEESTREMREEMDKPDYKEKFDTLVKEWEQEARKQTLKTLPGFLAKLAEHKHDYNSIVQAVAFAALGAACAMDHSPHGGITGFQAGGVFWEFYRAWLHEDGPVRLVKYQEMLWPQYEEQFGKTVSPSTLEWLQEKARKELAEIGDRNAHYKKHMQDIVDGKLPWGYRVKG